MNPDVNRIKKILFLVLSIIGMSVQNTQSMDSENKPKKYFDSFMYFADQKISGQLRQLFYGRINKHFDASPEHKELGLEAQIALEIPLKYQVPIKAMPKQVRKSLVAYAEPNAIYFNESSTLSFGQKRFAAFHEAAHIKYHDHAITHQLLAFSLSCYFLLNYFFEKPISIGAFFMAANYGAGIILRRNHERRADTTAAWACKCYKCINEQKVSRPSQKDPLTNVKFFYLNSEELKVIADQLKKDGQLCPHHKFDQQKKS